MRSLTVAIRSSPQRLAKFKEGLLNENLESEKEGNYSEDYDGCDDILNLVPVLDVPTRWSSMYYMIKRAIKLRNGFDYITGVERELRDYEISPDNWKLIREMYNFLEPFAETTKHIEGCKYATLPFVVPLFNELLDFTEDWINNTSKSSITVAGAKAAMAKLDSYYTKTASVQLVATILDPSLKIEYFTDHGWEIGSEEYGGENLIETRVKPA